MSSPSQVWLESRASEHQTQNNGARIIVSCARSIYTRMFFATLSAEQTLNCLYIQLEIEIVIQIVEIEMYIQLEKNHKDKRIYDTYYVASISAQASKFTHIGHPGP